MRRLLYPSNCWRQGQATLAACHHAPVLVNHWHTQQAPAAAKPTQHHCRRLQALAASQATEPAPSAEVPISAAPSVNPSIHTSSGAVAAAAPPKPTKPKRKRLDEVCMELRPELSRNLIQSWIVQGKATIDGKVIKKAGTPVKPTSKVALTAEEPKYVCRAGHKLEAALQHFGVDVAGLRCLDSGQSTGGFSDCLLQRGAAHVYGIDVGYGQLADKVRRDERVTVMERFNVRHLKPSDLPTQVDLATLDLAFISVLKVAPAVVSVLAPAPSGQLLVLIKPQFEAGRAQVTTGGVVRDPAVHKEVVKRVTEGINALGFVCKGVIESPLKGDKSGNTEFLAHFVRDTSRSGEAVAQAVAAALAAAGPVTDEEEKQLLGLMGSTE